MSLPYPFGYFAECFVSLIFAILFIQSGLDKVIDRTGNLEWLKGVFLFVCLFVLFVMADDCESKRSLCKDYLCKYGSSIIEVVEMVRCLK